MAKITYKQHDITDCGAACLASAAAYYGLQVPIARIRQMASTDKRGTNVAGLLEAAQKLGFTAKGVKGKFESLAKIPLPAIAHLTVKEGQLHHFAVIYKVTSTYIKIMDPASGKVERKPIDEFEKEWTGILVLLVPDENFKKENKDKAKINRFWQLIRPHRSIMLQALFGAVITSILGLSISIYVQKIVDNVIPNGNQNLLNLLSVVMIAILLLNLFISIMRSIFALMTGQKIDAALILGYYKHLMTLPQQFFDTMCVGEITSRIGDVGKIRAFINNTAIGLLVNVLTIIVTLLLMLAYSWKLFIVILLSIPLFMFIYWIYNKLNKKYLRKVMEEGADLESQLVESLNSMGTVKRFGLEETANYKTETRFVKLLSTMFKTGKYSIFTSNGLTLISSLATIIVLWFGASLVIDQTLTPGELMSFYALVGYIMSPIIGLVTSNQSIQDALIAADRLFQIMDLEREETEQTIKITLTPEMIGDIKFSHVNFRYGTRVNVFEDLNLNIEKGKMTAIVGESGSGKTTLMSILQNIYIIQSGSIEIGNYNINHIKLDSLRKLIGVVPQKIDLFSENIVDNIAIGEDEPDMKRALDICRLLSMESFIEKLPNNYATYIGENGASLSGGEKQRIAIARALYKKPEVLILDEATSSLDSASEKYVQQAVEFLKDQQKTIIVIAHRLSTIKKADKIICLHGGKVIEQGTHDELIKAEGNYYNMWKQQLS
ncbi:MAG: peptidase domain-containing ABC transporter [Prevotellaceae bacterium]|jgi:ATP-binding cassette subfamily B protein|nr:peptidase domain-containing ABC transporter [Prevotellaceae bacterium]